MPTSRISISIWSNPMQFLVTIQDEPTEQESKPYAGAKHSILFTNIANITQKIKADAKGKPTVYLTIKG